MASVELLKCVRPCVWQEQREHVYWVCTVQLPVVGLSGPDKTAWLVGQWRKLVKGVQLDVSCRVPRLDWPQVEAQLLQDLYPVGHKTAVEFVVQPQAP